jgi:hypothetical protein
MKKQPAKQPSLTELLRWSIRLAQVKAEQKKGKS